MKLDIVSNSKKIVEMIGTRDFWNPKNWYKIELEVP
jgi:hypothetical protein